MTDSNQVHRFDWLSEYLARLEDEHVIAHHGDARVLAPAHRLELDPEDWVVAARLAAGMGMRHAGVWADPLEEVCPDTGLVPEAARAGQEAPEEPCVRVRACLELGGDYLVIETDVPLGRPLLGSQTPVYPGLDRLERHAHDLTGVVFTGHPDERRWTRHQAWPEDRFPLRRDFPLGGESVRRTPADADYPFVRVQGAGVYEIPVGPVHAGIIEPGHFRFQAMGEDVLRLEERLGYVHKGIEKLAVGRDPAGLARLAGRVSGDSTVAHAWAACQAMERAARCTRAAARAQPARPHGRARAHRQPPGRHRRHLQRRRLRLRPCPVRAAARAMAAPQPRAVRPPPDDGLRHPRRRRP